MNNHQRLPVRNWRLTDRERELARTEGSTSGPGTQLSWPSDGAFEVYQRCCTELEGLRTATDVAISEICAEHRQEREGHPLAAIERGAANLIRSEKRRIIDEITAIDRLRKSGSDTDAVADVDDSRARDPERAWAGLPSRARFWITCRSSVGLIVLIAIVESVINAGVLFDAGEDGFLSVWLRAGLITGLNVLLLGYVIGRLILTELWSAWEPRSWKAWTRNGIAIACLVFLCLPFAVVVNLGFAHYRDAAAGSLVAPTKEWLDDHPELRISRDQAVLNELRAGFSWVPLGQPSRTFVVHPADMPANDHTADIVRTIPAERVGYIHSGIETLYLMEDEAAGRLNEWHSAGLLILGFAMLILSSWKFYRADEHRASEIRKWISRMDVGEENPAVDRPGERINQEREQLTRELETLHASIVSRVHRIQNGREMIEDRIREEPEEWDRRCAVGSTALEEYRLLIVGSTYAGVKPPDVNPEWPKWPQCPSRCEQGDEMRRRFAQDEQVAQAAADRVQGKAEDEQAGLERLREALLQRLVDLHRVYDSAAKVT